MSIVTSSKIYESEPSICSGHSGSSEKKRSYTLEKARSKWDGHWDFVLVTIAGIFSLRSFNFVSILENGRIRPTLFHTVVSFYFVGLPMTYMQIILGQYSQLGLTNIRYICPLAHGLEYNIVIVCIEKTFHFAMAIGSFYFYFVNSTRRKVPWLICPAHHNGTCWDLGHSWATCKKSCINKTVTLSTIVYYKQVLFKLEGMTDPNYFRMEVPARMRLIMILLTCSSIYLTLIYQLNHYRRYLLKSAIFSICLLLILATVFVSNQHGHLITEMLKVSYVFDFGCWCWSLLDMVQVLGLGRGIFTMHGTYLNHTAPAGILSLGCVTFAFILVVLSDLIIFSSYEIILKHTHMDYNTHFDDIFPYSTIPCYYTLIAQALGLLPARNLWTITFYFLAIVLTSSNQTVNVLLLEKAVTDNHPNLAKYRSYLVGILCFIVFLISVFLSPDTMHSFRIKVEYDINIIMEIFNIFGVSLTVFYIYGVQRLSDDIHFFTGSQPTAFWKICWWVSPPILLLPMWYWYRFTSVTSFLFLPPLITLCLYQIFRHIKARNLVGIFHSQERWGPADPEERHLRRLFNPRKEIKLRRRRTACLHHCLLDNKHLKKIVTDEQEARNEDKATQQGHPNEIEAAQSFYEKFIEQDIEDI